MICKYDVNWLNFYEFLEVYKYIDLINNNMCGLSRSLKLTT